jgi:hypothetical protein
MPGRPTAQGRARGDALPQPGEIAHLADKLHSAYRALVFVGAYGGLRIGELADHLRAPGRPTDQVFKARGGGQLRISNFRRNIWRPAVADANLAGLRIHDLRHTAVALWIAAGASNPEPSP